MRKLRMWVLIADATSARICSSTDGTSMYIPAPADVDFMRANAPCPLSVEACKAWYQPNKRNLLMMSDIGHFAAHLAQILHEGAREHAYDELIVIATPEIAQSLKRTLTPETCALLVGEVIRDIPNIAAGEAEITRELRH